jgi:hypothetical protein
MARTGSESISLSAASVRARTLEAAKEHLLTVGEVVYAANRLHDAFYRVFHIALSLERAGSNNSEKRFYDHALAIWHVVLSDSSQRDMAIAAISTIPTEIDLSPALRRVKWAKKQADILGGFRNIIAHNSIMFELQIEGRAVEWVPSFGGRGTRPLHKAPLGSYRRLGFLETLAK